MRHIPVLLNEVIESLQLAPGKNVVDCTLGDGGHTEEILKLTAPAGRVLGIDADPEAILQAKKYLYSFEDRIIFVRDNFVNLKKIVVENNFQSVNGILLDLGWSSTQFEERGRGFSFQKDEPLDMRYEANIKKDIESNTAADLLNNLSIGELGKIFKDYGEEKLADLIGRAIVNYRKKQEIKRTTQLVEIVLQVYREKLKTDKEIPWVGGVHPATKVFQALRIVVNNELGILESSLGQAIELLEKGGRLSVITFHSLEDRIVKHYFKSQKDKTIKLISKKPIICSPEEFKSNPRARSAKLRVVEKI